MSLCAVFTVLMSTPAFASSTVHNTFDLFSNGTHSQTNLTNQGVIKLGGSSLHTDTAESDFTSGTYFTNSSTNKTDVNNSSGGEITISQEKYYSNQTMEAPLTAGNNSSIIFNSTNGPTPVVNITDTKNTASFSDDVLLGYYGPGGVVDIPMNVVDGLRYVNETGILYISRAVTVTGGAKGVSVAVIDTKGTTAVADDVLAGTYTPAIFSQFNNLETDLNFYYNADSGFLFITTVEYQTYPDPSINSIYKIDTKKTNSTSDDTLVFDYNSNSAAGKTVLRNPRDLYFNNTSSTLYYASMNPLDYTLAAFDTITETYVGYYGPSHSLVNSLYSDSAAYNGSLIYTPGAISSNRINVIDTHNTQSLGDDTLSQIDLASYGVLTVGSLLFNSSNNTLVMVCTYMDGSVDQSGVCIFNLNTNLLTKFIKNTDSPILSDLMFSSLWNDNTLLLSGNDNWFVINDLTSTYTAPYNDLSIPYFSQGSYVSPITRISSLPAYISWNQTLNNLNSSSVSLNLRTGVREGDEWSFANNDLSQFQAFTYWAGDTFSSITTDNDNVQFRNPTGSDSYYSFNSGRANGYYPLGSTVSVRLRSFGTQNRSIYLFMGEYNGSDYEIRSPEPGVWYDVTFPYDNASDVPIVSFEMFSSGGSFTSEDYIEVEYIKIYNDTWGDWQTLGSDNSYSSFTSSAGNNIFQYSIALSASGNLFSAPVINSVSFNQHLTTGTYTSSVIDAGSIVDWGTLTDISTTPALTTISYSTRTGDTSTPDGSWSAWQAVNSPIASPNSRYLQYKIDMTGTTTVTPSVSSVTVSYSPPSDSGSDDSNSSNSTDSSSTSSNNNSNPSCPNPKPLSAPDLFQINTSKTTATLFFNSGQAPFDRIFVSYGLTPGSQEYGVEYLTNQKSGIQSYTIKELNPNTKYYFKVRSGNGCTPGDWSNEMLAQSSSKSNSNLIFYKSFIRRVISIFNPIKNPIATTQDVNITQELLVSVTPSPTVTSTNQLQPESPVNNLKVTESKPSFWQKILRFFGK